MAIFRRFVASILCVAVLNLSSPLVAQAGVIGTLQAVESQQRAADLATVNSALAREQVRAELSAMGVDAAHVETRLGAMTDAELRSLAGEIDNLPAGADALAVIGIVFLVLLILEAVGVLDIFKSFP
jgi:uncharacterized membrane protein (Fun14 family)